MSDTLEVWLCDDTLSPADVQVGTLFRGKGRGGEVVRFEYALNWLDPSISPGAFAIDPELPLTRGPLFPQQSRVLAGIFLDMAPDRWGRVLMERRELLEAADGKRAVRNMRDWDFLVGVNDATRMGGLRLRNAATHSFVDARELGAPPLTRLRELEDIASRIDQRGADQLPQYREWLKLLVVPGTSLGGARPKASFMDTDGSLWLAKFPSGDDRRNVGLWEFLAYRLATAASINMPSARVHAFSNRGHTFAVRRFDRSPSSRRVYASAMTLLQRREGDSASYLDLAELIEQGGDVTTLRSDLSQLFRRIAFSILIGNRDDHLRNHGFLRTMGGWRLAPAFDINPNPDKDVHALAIDAADPSPSTHNLMTTRDFYRLSKARAQEILTEVKEVVRTWPELATEIGIGRSETIALASVIDPDR